MPFGWRLMVGAAMLLHSGSSLISSSSSSSSSGGRGRGSSSGSGSSSKNKSYTISGNSDRRVLGSRT